MESSTASAAAAADAPAPSAPRALAAGALVGAALGALELALALGLRPEPSLARRGAGLLAATCLWYALAGALVALLAHAAGASARDARGRRARSTAALVAALAALLALAWLGTASVGGTPLWQLGRRWRWGALLALSLAAGALGLAAGAWRARRAPARLRPSPLVRAALLVLAGASAALLVASARASGASARASAPDPAGAPRTQLLLVVVDTLRADALSCYGAPPGSTPVLDRLAERGVLLEDVQSVTSWTIPAVASLLTARSPAEHGVDEFSGVLRAQDATLFEALAGAGYDCAAFLGNPLVSPRGGFDRGFRLFDCYDYRAEGERLLQRAGWELARLAGLVRFPHRLNPVLRPSAAFPFVATRPQRSSLDEDLARSLLRWAPPARGVPRATYAQPVGPHDPYFERPATFGMERVPLVAADVARLRRLYAGEVAATDRALGEILARYEAAGVLDDTLVVVTADHGEEFLEHGGLQHGHSLFGEVLRVPCLIAGPGVARGARVARRVSLVDLAPTICELLGVPAPASFRGTSLAPLVRAGGAADADAGGPVFASLSSRILNGERRWSAVLDGRWKLVRERLADGTLRESVFDLRADPLERSPLAALPPEATGLREALLAHEALAVGGSERPLEGEEQAALQALGYGGGAPPR